jgi:GH25 family lysozyme M1 (1,4-beta-N-acetylmuramidase)
MKGVDISHYQKGLTIRQLKDAGYEFAIIKLTEGIEIVDKSAFDFYREAYELGFPVGCYCYSHATTPKQAAAEAGHLLDILNGFPMPLGIYLDVEEPKQLGLFDDELRDVIRTWCAGIAQHGYIPGVYGSEGNLWAKVHPDELPAGTMIWVAKWSQTPPNTPCDLWQTSDSGRVDGYSGAVDTDETRGQRLEGLIRNFSGYKPADKPPDVPTDSGGTDPVELASDLLLAYLRSGEFSEGFSEYVKNSLAMIERT